MAKRIVAVCLDFGDTLSDEATEARDEAGTLASIELMRGLASCSSSCGPGASRSRSSPTESSPTPAALSPQALDRLEADRG